MFSPIFKTKSFFYLAAYFWVLKVFQIPCDLRVCFQTSLLKTQSKNQSLLEYSNTPVLFYFKKVYISACFPFEADILRIILADNACKCRKLGFKKGSCGGEELWPTLWWGEGSCILFLSGRRCGDKLLKQVYTKGRDARVNLTVCTVRGQWNARVRVNGLWIPRGNTLLSLGPPSCIAQPANRYCGTVRAVWPAWPRFRHTPPRSWPMILEPLAANRSVSLGHLGVTWL